MKTIAGAFYSSMIIQFVRKVIRRLSGIDLWDDFTGWTKVILSKQDINAGIDGYDICTYCPDDGLYHGWTIGAGDDDRYVKFTADVMNMDEHGQYWVKNRFTGVLARATPISMRVV